MRIGQKLSIPLLLLIISTIITGITENKNPIPYTLIFLCFLIPLFFVKKQLINKKSISWGLLVLALVIQYKCHVTDLTGFSILFLSMAISTKSKKVYILSLSLFSILVLYKFNKADMVPSQITAYLSGLSFATIIYQHFIHPIRDNEYTANYSNTVIEKIYIDIITLYINGYSWSKISSELSLNVTGKSVQRTLDKEWRRRKFKNREQFAHYMGQMGIIKAIDKNLITE